MQYTVNSGDSFFQNPFKVPEFSLLKKVPVKKINLKLTHFVTSISLPLSRLYSIWNGYILGAHCPCYTLHSIWVYIQYPCGNWIQWCGGGVWKNTGWIMWWYSYTLYTAAPSYLSKITFNGLCSFYFSRGHNSRHNPKKSWMYLGIFIPFQNKVIL